jgi:UDP-glucose 4-epimerase
MYAVSHSNDTVNTYNVGSEDWICVTDIADIISKEMGLSPEFNYTGGTRGWIGDVPKMQLDITHLKGLGYSSLLTSKESVDSAVRSALGKTG